MEKGGRGEKYLSLLSGELGVACTRKFGPTTGLVKMELVGPSRASPAP